MNFSQQKNPLSNFLRLLPVCLLVAAAFGSFPQKVDGGQLFPDSVTKEDLHLVKMGEYRYVYRVFFRLYDAALFAPADADAQSVLSRNVPFHLEFRYLREIEKPIILKSAERMLEKNLTAAERSQIAERVKRLNTAYVTVRDGDASSLFFRPDHGTTLSINGKTVKTIEGDDFAELYFRIWLGEQPLSKDLKSALLGKSR